MPNETDNKGNQDQGAGQSQAANNQGQDNSNAGNDNNQGSAGAGEVMVSISQKELDQIKTDRDNYKTGLLSKKADERNLDNKGSDQGDGNNNNGSGQGNNAVIDEAKVSDVATAATNKALRVASEKSAKRTFLKSHPEYLDDGEWTNLLANLTFKGNELTSDEILDRMEAAVLEHKRSNGKLDEYLNSQRERGRQEGRIEGNFDSGRSGGGAGDKNEGGGNSGNLSAKGEEMARAMHTDPEKVKKVDPLKDNVINVL